MVEIQLCQGIRVWTAYIDPTKIALIEGTNQSQTPLQQKARILIEGVWLHTNETVEHILDLIK